MKPLVIAASLLANAVLLVALALRPALAPPAIREFIVRHFHVFGGSSAAPSAAGTVPASRAAGSGGAAAPRLLGPAFETDDFLTLQARLRAAGFPADVIVEIGRREIDARYDAKIRALANPDPDMPFWKTSPEALAATGRRGEQISQLLRERDKAYRDFVNDPVFFTVAALDIGQRRMWGDLPRDKLDRIQRIDDDYTDMMSAVRSSANGVILAADREKLELLEREKQADIMAVMSPAELAEYKLRTSSVGFASRLRLFEPSEAEWRTLAQAQLDLNAGFSATGGFNSADPEQRRVALENFETRMKSALGETRFADYLRTTNPEFQQLSHLAEVDRLPATAAKEAFGVRDRVAMESNRIFDDPALDPAQKRAALQTLAQSTRTQLLALLGPTSGPAYVALAERWLSNVANGSAVTFASITPLSTGNGNVTLTGGPAATYRRLPGSPNSAPPPGGVIILRK